MDQETLKTLARLRAKSEDPQMSELDVAGRAAEFEGKFSAVRKHTLESLTKFANEWIEDIQEFIVERNGVYHGKVIN